ncbi:S8 family serine peptidase [Sphingobacterium faecium]|uniref:S8 family serine peptidase n=1 Tax=Sphingobacterium faecium TaxID=34087 RepID=UPI00320AF7D3
MNKPHVRLNTLAQFDIPISMKYNNGFGEKEEDPDEAENEIANYKAMGVAFKKCLVDFKEDRVLKYSKRNDALGISTHFDFIKITFLNQFSVQKFYSQWYRVFGLEIVEVFDFGRTILFAVSEKNNSNLDTFIKNIETFIQFSEDQNPVSFSPLLLYMKSFELLKVTDINETYGDEQLIILRLADISINSRDKRIMLKELENYLAVADIKYSLNEELELLEISDLKTENLEEILENFDIVIQVISSQSTMIRPDIYNIPERNYGFEVSVEEGLPIVGIIDSGIDERTPIINTVIVDHDLNITASLVTEDNIDQGRGHGTAVGALASLGSEGVSASYQGTLISNARLLPIKIIDDAKSFISVTEVLRLLYLAKEKYPTIKIFTLTINFDKPKKFNEAVSRYAYALDKFSFEHDCLIFISIGNNSQAIFTYNGYDKACFSDESSILGSPAESMNNLTIGACSDSIKDSEHCGISNGKEYPTLYSRRGHHNYTIIDGKPKINKKIFKPDLLFPGGDYAYKNGKLIDIGESCILLLSADPSESFYESMGTSFAAPLAANIAAKLQRIYPSLRAPSIKALMLNCADNNLVDFDESIKHSSVGHGNINSNHVLYSDENRAVIIMEETINHEECKVYPLKFPEYLVKDDLKKVRGILKITATLCFNFLPIKDNQQGYCPVHMAFGIFKNHHSGQIIQPEDEIKSKLKGNMWSQNGRYKSRPIPYSNVQKISMPINVSELLDEENIFKLGVHCLVHPQLKPGESDVYMKNNKFSIVISIEENLVEKRRTGKLYDEITVINEVESIINTSVDLDLEA